MLGVRERRAAGGLKGVDAAGQRFDSRVFEEGAKGQFELVGFEDACEHLVGDEGVAADVEEIVVARHGGEVEKFGEGGGDEVLGGGLGWVNMVRGFDRGAEGERAAIDFSIGGEGQGFQVHEARGNHERRERAAKEGGEFVDRGLAYEIGREDVIFYGRGCQAHGGVLEERGFYFLEFEAVAAELDLVIDAAEVFEIAVGQLADAVAGAEKAVLGEFFGG